MPDLSLGQLLQRELDAGVEAIQVHEETVDVQGLTGPENREARSELAEALAGSSERSSRAYRSQRRNVERWAKGRVPMLVTIRRIINVQTARRRLWATMRAAGADVRFKVSWYAERKPEWLPPGDWLRLKAAEIGPVLDLAERDAWERAAGLLWRTFLKVYNVPNPTDWLRDVEIIDLRVRP